MLVYKEGSETDILGFTCDLCGYPSIRDVVPNKYGEFHYICPNCGHHMLEVPEKKEEETNMVNTYTVTNAAKRLNCSKSTIMRAIQDGRFYDCFTEIGYHGRPAWMIPSDQVEKWVTSGDFLQPSHTDGKFLKQKDLPKKDAKLPEGAVVTERNKDGKPVAGRYPFGHVPEEKPRMVFDPEVGKEVAVLNLLGNTSLAPEEDEFAKRAVKRVAKPKWTRVYERSEKQKEEQNMKECTPVRPDNGDISITIPKNIISDILASRMKASIEVRIASLRKAINTMNEELKALEEAIA